MEKKVTLEDIAKAAGVSKNTVSIALRDRPGVSESVRKRVLDLAHDMKYERPTVKRIDSAPRYILSLLAAPIAENAASHPSTVGLIPRLYFQLQTTAQEQNYIAIPYTLYPDAEQSCALPPILDEMDFIGIVVFGCVSAQYLKTLIRHGYHVVTMHAHVDGVQTDAVTNDDAYAGFVMTEHLIRMGHQRIVYMGEKNYMAKYMDRWEGYCRAMCMHGLPIVHNEYSEACIQGQTEEDETRRLKESLSAMSPMPTAIVCGEDFTAARIRAILQKMDYRVPEDVSLVGFDDVYVDGHRDFPLTTYRADHVEMARSAVELLMTPGSKPRKIVIYGQPVYRKSVRKLSLDK